MSGIQSWELKRQVVARNITKKWDWNKTIVDAINMIALPVLVTFVKVGQC